MAGPHFHLQTFGELRLVDSGGVVVACPERGLLILAYLCISGQRTVSREKLAMLIWPEREKSVAFKNLRSTLWRMRHLAAGSAPLTSATEIDVTLGEIACDAAGFETLGRSEQAFRTGLSLWRDTFLASADVPPGRYADWVGEQRSVFTQKLRAALIAGGERFADRSMLRTACMHLLELDPADPAVRAMLERLTGVSLVIRDGPPDGARLRQGAFTGEPARAPARDAMTPPVAPAPRVALLPPAAFGSDPMLHAVSMAVVEDITIGLCALRSMSVVAPYTAERIRDAADKAAFLEKHGVTYALDCRMSDQGLFTQLIFLPSDAIVWAERFSISPVGLLQQRQEIAFHVASAVAEQVETGRIKHLDYVTNPEAYYAYLAGLRNLSNVGLPEIRRARRDFKTALRHKPDFAPALSGIARTYAIEWILTARGDQELLTVAERHAKEAIESNEELPGAHREFGVVRLYQGDLDESLAALDLAENLSPHYADVLYSHADTLVHASRPREALDKLGKALSLNPLAPDMYFWSAAGASYFLEEYEDAIGYVQKMNDKSPGDRLLAASWAMLGDQKKARSYKVKALRANPTFDVDKWLAVVPMKEQWQKDLYREGLKKAGF